MPLIFKEGEITMGVKPLTNRNPNPKSKKKGFKASDTAYITEAPQNTDVSNYFAGSQYNLNSLGWMQLKNWEVITSVKKAVTLDPNVHVGVGKNVKTGELVYVKLGFFEGEDKTYTLRSSSQPDKERGSLKDGLRFLAKGTDPDTHEDKYYWVDLSAPRYISGDDSNMKFTVDDQSPKTIKVDVYYK